MKSLKEELLATPMNTLGAGGIDPCGSDPIPTKKRKMKSLKEKIREKTKEHVKEKDINGEY